MEVKLKIPAGIAFGDRRPVEIGKLCNLVIEVGRIVDLLEPAASVWAPGPQQPMPPRLQAGATRGPMAAVARIPDQLAGVSGESARRASGDRDNHARRHNKGDE
jgi:hypothetical protein